MYKLLLCWRYLLTRYLALACIISVMLGVATLIVVNSVMAGFSKKLKDRLHGLLSDIVVESRSLDGFPGSAVHIDRIRQSRIGHRVEAMTATVEIFAMLQFRGGGQTITRPVRLIGIDPLGRASVGGFSEYLVRQRGNPQPTFEIPAEVQWRYLGAPTLGQLTPPAEKPTPPAQQLTSPVEELTPPAGFDGLGGLTPREPPPPDPPESHFKMPRGVILGNAIASFRKKVEEDKPAQDIYVLHPGDEVILTTVSAGKMVPVFDRFVVCDFFKSEMSEYDAQFVFVPIDYLQRLRAMDDRVTTIQIKLRDYAHAREVVDELRMLFPPEQFAVMTWEDKQGPLLAAISIEKGILNILLFLIVGVAGFGILAIFSMIVVEKTRDIGILKALGASNRGVMSIFLGYGLLLGIVGALAGTLLGLEFTWNINEIEHLLARVTGQEIFDRTVYYFNEIPTDIQPMAVLLVNAGAVAIAVLFSILPALRAAMLHPVRALRYE